MRQFVGILSFILTLLCASAGFLRVIFNHHLPDMEFALCCLVWIVPLVTTIFCFTDPFGVEEQPPIVLETKGKNKKLVA